MAKYKIVGVPKKTKSSEYFELDLTPEEIQEYAKGGFIIEDISVPTLNHMQDGGIVEYNGFQYKKDNSGNWTNATSGAPVTDKLLAQKLTYEGKPVGSPVVQGAPKPNTPIAIKKEQVKTLKNSPVIADQNKYKQVQNEEAYINAVEQAKIREQAFGFPQHEQPLDMMDYAWGAAAALPAVLPAMGELAATNILGTPLTYGNVGSLAFATNSALNTDNVVQDWRDVYAGKKDWRDAALNTGVTGLGFIGVGSGVKNLANTLNTERVVASAMPGFNTARTLELNKFINNESKLLPQGFGNGSTPLALPSVPVTNMIEATQSNFLDLAKVQKKLPGSPNVLPIETPAGFNNRVWDSNFQLGTAPQNSHMSELGYNYRTVGPEEIKAIQETNGVFPRAGKAKGGNRNVKYWTKGNEKNWYGGNPEQNIIRVNQDKFAIDKVVNANNVEIYNHSTNSFEPILSYKQKLEVPEIRSVANTASSVETVKPIWQPQQLSGLHLKSTMTDGPISKIVESKTGLINTEQALGIIAKESGGAEKVAMIKQALGETIPKKMDYNDFRKLVQDQLIPLEKQLVNHSSTFGLQRIGHSPMESQVKTYGLGDFDDAKIIENQTILFSNKNKFGIGSDAHSNPEETLGHAHFFRDSETPDALTITQLQSDAFQGPYRVMPKKGLDSEELDKELFKSRRMEEIQNRNKIILDKMKNERVDFNGNPVEDYQIKQFEEIVNSQEESNLLRKAHIEGFNQKSLLDKNHQERYIQEIVNYAAERGDINRLRLPTSETAAKIQGYRKTLPVDNQMDRDRIDMELDYIFRTYGPESQELRDFYEYQEALKQEALKNTKNENMIPDYSPEHKTILKKYAEQPKIIKKLYGIEPKIVTDGKGNTWYEFNIPYEFREGPAEIKAFKHGGSTSKLSKFIG